MKKLVYKLCNLYYRILAKLGFCNPEVFLSMIKAMRKDIFFAGDIGGDRLNNHRKYYQQNDIQVKDGKIFGKAYHKLVENLDSESKHTVDNIIKRIYQLSTHSQQIYTSGELFFDEKIKNKLKQIYSKRSSYKKYGYLPVNQREDSVFYYHCGLKNLKKKVDLQGKDILDCGAFIGDSALMFDKEVENYNKIYCFEPTKKNYNFLQMTIKRNHKINKFVAVNNGVGDKNETLTLKNGGSSSSINNDKLSGKTETINIVTIDDYVTNHNLIPGLIKRDIEGFELESLKGAEKTIKKYKPLLLISIYHTGKDFFEIKPLIESYNLGYIYQIVHNNPLHPYYETVLICH